MRWWTTLEEFGPNITHIDGFYNIVADTLSILPSTSVDKYEPITRKAQCCANESFTISTAENNEYLFALNILNVQREKQQEKRNRNYKLSTYISDLGPGYSKQNINWVDITCYDIKIDAPQSPYRHVIGWYSFYINHPGGSILVKKTRILLLERPCHANRTVW